VPGCRGRRWTHRPDTPSGLGCSFGREQPLGGLPGFHRRASAAKQTTRGQAPESCQRNVVPEPISATLVFQNVTTFLLWCLLLVVCWPLALLALVLYPIVWLLLLPFRILGIAVDGVLGVIRGIVMLPVRLLRGPRAA
jgi:hypothetical protein